MMPQLKTIQFCIGYIKDTIHDVMPSAQEYESFGRDEYSKHCRNESAQWRFV